MRRVLLIAIAGLALVGLRQWHLRGIEEQVDGQVAHRLMSTGWGLGAGLRARPEGLGAVWIGRQWFVPEDGADGLRVAATTLSGDVLDFFNYDLTRPGAARGFAQHCRKRDVGTVLSLALRGSMRNSDPELRELLSTTCTELGARAAPIDLETASWALVARRTRDGWVALGEAFSPARGVVLTVPLGDISTPIDLIERGGPQVVSWIARQIEGAGRDRIRFAMPLAHGTCDILRWGLGARVRRGGLPFELELDLGREPRFECTLVIGPSTIFGRPGKASGRAEIVLRVNGDVAARKELVAESKELSEPWSVDLADHAGSRVKLELSVEATGVSWAAAAAPLVLFD